MYSIPINPVGLQNPKNVGMAVENSLIFRLGGWEVLRLYFVNLSLSPCQSAVDDHVIMFKYSFCREFAIYYIFVSAVIVLGLMCTHNSERGYRETASF